VQVNLRSLLVPVAEDDWRRMGQERFLTDLKFAWKRYQAFSGNWEHEHCEFCSKKFLDALYADWMRVALADKPDEYAAAGYTNRRHGDIPAGRFWICKECFSDFLPEYRWAVEEADPESWPYDAPEPKPRPTASDFDADASSQSP
jgi:hypothetical protein